jgi:hypothetical protein
LNAQGNPCRATILGYQRVLKEVFPMLCCIDDVKIL